MTLPHADTIPGYDDGAPPSSYGHGVGAEIRELTRQLHEARQEAEGLRHEISDMLRERATSERPAVAHVLRELANTVSKGWRGRAQ